MLVKTKRPNGESKSNTGGISIPGGSLLFCFLVAYAAYTSHIAELIRGYLTISLSGLFFQKTDLRVTETRYLVNFKCYHLFFSISGDKIKFSRVEICVFI